MDGFSKVFKKGENFRRKGKYDKALNQYSLCLEYDQDNAPLWSALAYCYNLKGQFDEAIIAANRALEIDENLYSAMDNLFFSYDQKKNHDKQIGVLKVFLETCSKLQYNFMKNEKLLNDLTNTFFKQAQI